MTRQTVRQVLATPVLAAGCCFGIILIAGICAGFVPVAWQGNWTDHIVARQPHFVARFFPFDAVWYQTIATGGYSWDPAQSALKQDVAFFPLWPLLLRFVAICSPSIDAARIATVLLAGLCATASIVAFHVLALRLLPPRPARTATFLFALYPGASFLLLSYPTGLMNLLVILALLALLDERFFIAAALAGFLTAIGPLGLGTAFAVVTCAAAALHGAEDVPVWRRLLRLAAIGALSISGLVGFLAWQYAVLGDPFAFIKAQAAWAVPLPWPQRIPRAILQLLVLPDFVAAARELGHAVKAHGLVALQANLEKSLYLAAEGGELITTAACAWFAPRPLLLQGAFTMALFIWFDAASRPGHATLRLTYCIIGVFFGAAWLLRDRPRLAACTIGLSAAMLACAAFLQNAGYHVV